MRERLELVGGKFTITSKPGAGTHIEALIPIAKQHQERSFPLPMTNAGRESDLLVK
jgi:signal transduction histidine kinase